MVGGCTSEGEALELRRRYEAATRPVRARRANRGGVADEAVADEAAHAGHGQRPSSTGGGEPS
jgi:hypothetical protein